jgi:hypothetical protein
LPSLLQLAGRQWDQTDCARRFEKHRRHSSICPTISVLFHGRDPTGFLDVMPAVKVQLGAFPGDVVFSATAGLGFLTGASRISVPVTIPISGSLGRGRSERLGSQWLFIEFWFTGQKSNAISEATFVVEQEVGTHADLFVEYVGDCPNHGEPSQIINSTSRIGLPALSKSIFTRASD